MAQTKGRFEVHDLDNFKLHVYYTNDALGDASYIVEGKDALVTMEQPLFKDNVVEFDAYLSRLEKPVEKRITDYHVGGTGSHDVVMAEGMPEFTKGEIYGGMMQGFAQAFGDALTDMPTGKTAEVAFGTTQTWAGVAFEFRRGATTDFPGASILIGGKVYYTHWTPVKAHVSHFGCDAVCRRTRRCCYTRCCGVQNCLSEEDERVACGKQNGTNFRGCDERGLSRSGRRGRP